jgi:hypothetical protein
MLNGIPQEDYLMSHELAEKGTDGQSILRRKSVPPAMAKGPFEYIPGDQEPLAALPILRRLFKGCQAS